jgi:outer membrane immunogenic protein
MKRKLIALLSGIIGLGACGAASAADMAVKARPVAAPIPVFSWTGCYVGGHAGGLWVRKNFVGDVINTPAFGQNRGTTEGSDWLAGVQGGCDYQFANRIVIGIAGDYAWTNAGGTNTDILSAGFFETFRVDALASITGRVGYSWDRFLGYVKGGGAWERDNYSILLGTVLQATGSETRSGWTVGIGGEYAFTNWLSGFIEYNYYDFGRQSVRFNDPTGAFFSQVAIREEKSVVKAGLNFRWSPGAAVVAKY